jgi:hypothetical protein
MNPYQPPDDPDTDNPYAPPRSTYVPESLPELGTGMQFTVNDIFNWSLAIFKERMGLCLAMYWGSQGIIVAISLGMSMLLQVVTAVVRDRTMFTLSYILIQFFGIVIQVWLGIGQARAYLKIARGEPVAFEEIFQGGRYLLTTILASIIFILILLAPIMIAVVASTAGMVALGNQSVGGIAVFLVTSTLAGIFFIYVSSRLVVYYYLIIDRNAGVFDSLRQSWRLCRNSVFTIVLVFVVQFAIILAGFLALCVGAIFAIPLAGLLLPVTYLALTGTTAAPPGKPEFIWEEDL